MKVAVIREKARSIYNAIAPYRKNPFSQEFDSTYLVEHLASFVSKQKPIKLIIPAFHGKAKYCTFDHLPDYGEYLGVSNLVDICTLINRRYKNSVNLEESVELIVVHEGHLYADIPFAQTEEKATEYMDKIACLFKPFSFIKSMGLPDFFPSLKTNADRLVEFHKKFGISDDEIDEYLKKECREKSLYMSYKKIYSKHYRSIMFSDLSVKDVNLIASLYARKQLKLYLGFGKLVNEFFKNDEYIRLSTLYKSPDIVSQIAVNYLPNTHQLATPAFNCVLEQKNGCYKFIKYSEGIERGLEIKNFKYFKES